MSTDSRRERIATAVVGHIYICATEGLERLVDEINANSLRANSSYIDKVTNELPVGVSKKAVEIADALIAELDKPFKTEDQE